MITTKFIEKNQPKVYRCLNFVLVLALEDSLESITSTSTIN